MIRPWIFVGFSGHRSLAQPAQVRARLDAALTRLAAHTQAPLAAVSSAACGADTLFAEVALARSLPWTLLLPSAPESFFNPRDFTPAELARITPLVPRAAEVRIEAEPAIPAGEARRAEAFSACTARTVDECDYLIAVWNGASGQPGGTAEAVAYARALRKPILVIHPDTGATTEEHFPPAAPPHSEPTASAPRPLDATHGGLPELQATLAHYDALASHHAPAARDLVTRVILLHLAATAVGLIAPVFGILTWVALLPVVFKIGVLSYASRLAHRQQHAKEQWLHHRQIAELCRAAAGIWALPFSERVACPVLWPGLHDWQRSLRLWRLAAPPAPRAFAAQRHDYLAARLDSPTTGQIPYFERQHARAAARLARWERIAIGCTRLAIACSVFLLAKALYGVVSAPGPAAHHWWADAVKFLSLTLPLSTAAIFSWLTSSDCRRRAERNAAMLAFLRAARERVRHAGSWSALERQAAEIESALMLEILEWHSVAHFTAPAH